MKFERIPYRDVINLSPISKDDTQHISIFETLGTKGCLLDCEVWKGRQNVAGRRATTGAQRRERNKEIRALTESAAQKQRQTLKPGERVPNGVLQSKREPFKLKDLQASAKHGCGCCLFFSQLFAALISTHSAFVLEDLVFEWVRYNFLLNIKDEQSGQVFSYQLFSPSGAETTIQGAHSAAVLQGDTSSSSSFKKADEWIEKCKTTHGQCGAGLNAPLPKRCLDLEPLSSAGETGIRLAETDGIVGSYACLSHCWGKDPKPIETKIAFLNSHLQFIAWTKLSKTFQDSVIIARKLGMRYLWIDSLCIIQDSKLDWEVESSKMADIYRNSFITIAAVSSPDSRGGCFSPEKREDIVFRVEGNGVNTLLGARYCEGTGPARDRHGFSQSFPLFTRGWVYQERMLSRRILYCNHCEFQFECREMKTCECGNKLLPPHVIPGTKAGREMVQGKDEYAQLEKFQGASARFSPRQIAEHWQRSVMQYAMLRLTKGTDKLPALSGCAKDIGRFTGDKYLAGIWRSKIAEGMLWVVKGPVKEPRPEHWRAPTWSWASVDTPNGISYICSPWSRTRKAFQDKVEEASCILAGTDSTGAVVSGFISLRASVCPAYLRRICRRCMASGGGVAYIIEYDRWLYTRGSDVKPCAPKEIKGLDIGSASQSFYPDFKYADRVDFDFIDTGKYNGCRHARVFLLHLYDNYSPASVVITDFFLVLKPVAQSTGNSFSRIAVISLQFKNCDERASWFRSVFDVAAEKETLVTLV